MQASIPRHPIRFHTACYRSRSWSRVNETQVDRIAGHNRQKNFYDNFLVTSECYEASVAEIEIRCIPHAALRDVMPDTIRITEMRGYSSKTRLQIESMRISFLRRTGKYGMQFHSDTCAYR